MEQVIIGVTFFLGVGLTLVAIVALFRREKAGGGSLELLGVKLTASSASALFLVVGAAMILSGFAWASTDRKKTEAVKEATTFHAAYVKQVDLSRELALRAPAVVSAFPPEDQKRIRSIVVTPSPRLKAEVERVQPR